MTYDDPQSPASPPSPGYWWGYPPSSSPYVPVRHNTKALAALILSILSLSTCLVFVSPVAAVMGHIAQRQIRETGEAGEKFALVAVVLGWVGTGLLVIIAGSITVAIIVSH